MKIIGHRGARGLAPENTIAGLREALKHDLDGIEFDVRTTKDGTPVLSHDPSLEVASGAEYSIHAHTYEQLRGFCPDVCTLSAALRVINRRVPAYIDIKSGADTEPIVTIIRKLFVEGWKPHDFTFLSKDFSILKQLRAAFPEVPIIVNESWSSVRAVRRANALGTTMIDLNHLWLWPGVIQALHKRGYQLYTYPLNDPVKARRWETYGLAGIVTDYPDRMQSLRGPHNPWLKGA